MTETPLADALYGMVYRPKPTCPYCGEAGPLRLCYIFNLGSDPVCATCLRRWRDEPDVFMADMARRSIYHEGAAVT